MQIGSIVRTNHIAVPKGALGVIEKMLGNMAMVTWYESHPMSSRQLNTEPFFMEDLVDTGESLKHTQISFKIH